MGVGMYAEEGLTTVSMFQGHMEPCNQIDRDLGGERRKLNFATRDTAPWPLTFKPNTLWIHLFNLQKPDKRAHSVLPSKNLLEHGKRKGVWVCVGCGGGG